MLVVISPAKKLDMNPADGHAPTHPAFQDHAQELAAVARGLSHDDIRGLMGLSDSLAQLNVERFASFGSQARKPAVLSFAGDTYQGLEARTLDTERMAWAQDHLRILSGLYGLLRPMDLMQPYRLEMGTKFATQRGKDLYAFWGSIITDEINRLLAASTSPVLVNLASNEYFKSVQHKDINGRIITPVFMDKKDDKFKIISFYAKKARGLMSAYIIKNKITAVEGIKDFDSDGYSYNAAMSDCDSWVFTREQ